MGVTNKLVILSKDAGQYAELIARLNLPELEFSAAHTPRDMKGRIDECNILLGDPRLVKSVVNEAECIKWVQSTWAGADALIDAHLRSDYILTGVKGVFGQMITDYVFAYLLALQRNIFKIQANQQARRWQKVPFQTLQGRHLGVCGLGSIGRHVALAGKHFGMKVWGYKRVAETIPEIDGVFAGKDFRDFLALSDFVVITLPDTRDTFHLFDARAFEAMRETAVLMNVGRGNVVKEEALVKALKERQIGGAVLDVFEREPLPKESPLWTNPHVIVTPHIAAVSFPEDVVGIFAENYRRFHGNRPLLHVIDFSRGY